MLAEYGNTTMQRAFTMLRDYARTNGQNLTDLARSLTDRTTSPTCSSPTATMATSPKQLRHRGTTPLISRKHTHDSDQPVRWLGERPHQVRRTFIR